ncbi:hypothetical protein SOPP22_16340 [Shewanella sp. OPT22]|nr:hypothetical protein SOPP22_16340 [Shewanella sp. OPT22]
MWPSINGILTYLVGLRLSTQDSPEAAINTANEFWDQNKDKLNKEPTVIKKVNRLNQESQLCIYYGDMSDNSKPMLFISAFTSSRKANNFNQ